MASRQITSRCSFWGHRRKRDKMETAAVVRQADEEKRIPAREQALVEAAATLKHKPVYAFIKRAFDIVAALMLSIVLLLPIAVVSILIKLDSEGPVIFRQQRMGKDGKIFTMYKFRSMRTDAPSEVATRDFENSNEYITRFGGFLRRTSLDEIPQLLNILLGQMSFVGYRPV